ncbi:DUF4397 domain-containing protein [Pedobacter frigoris]|uniref:DUF4397 domain-containing protein n=1 Tax=Pedobacter frigoris TaxID=2571272 RepID=UPI0029318183|nr:DUF4397 domain-containing protein [Pedobacter frigoris]
MKNSYFLSKKAGTALLMSCLSLVVLLTSCVKEPKPEPTGEASVRFVNAVQGSSAQDVYVNGTKKSAVPLVYGGATSSFTITSGTNQFVFANEGAATGTTGTALNVPIGANFHVFMFRDKSTVTVPGEIVAGPVSIDATAPATGKAKVRFLHLNSYLNNSIAVSVVGGASLVTGVGFGASSNYFAVDPGAKLALAATGVTTGDIDPGFVAGKIYTIWFDGSSATELNGHVILEN